MGCWTPVERVGDGGDWSAVAAAPDGRPVRGAPSRPDRRRARVGAARRAQTSPTRWHRHRGRRGMRASSRPRRRVRSAASPGSGGGWSTARRWTGSRSTTTSPTIRPQSKPPSPRCARAARARPAKDVCSRCWSLRRTRCGAGRTARPSDRRSPGRMRRGCSPPRGACGTRRLGRARARARGRGCTRAGRHRYHRARVLRSGAPGRHDPDDEQRGLRRNPGPSRGSVAGSHGGARQPLRRCVTARTWTAALVRDPRREEIDGLRARKPAVGRARFTA